MNARVPSSTYRLQFHQGFTFQDATAVLEYLDDLGISDVYSSPYFQAGLQSTHGYDVADYNALNPGIGGDSAYGNFVRKLKKLGMGQLLDFVPNHMGISEPLNLWWMDVLEHGTASPYANYFDIDWHPGKEELSEKVLLPILGGRYGKVLESGELVLKQERGSFFIQYFKATLPVNPGTYPRILRHALSSLETKNADLLSRIIALFEASQGDRTESKSALHALIEGEPEVEKSIERVLKEFNGSPGSPSSFDSLHDLLDRQAYRLSSWRVAAEEINYRRFFDVTTLAAIRVEVPEVFEASHHLVLDLLARGDVTGLRIDHIDGLWNPREYLQRLENRSSSPPGQPGQTDSQQNLYVVVEKIIDTTREHFPSDWPVAGTTGYEFANQITGLLIDAEAEKHLTDTYHRFLGYSLSFSDLAYQKKKVVMETLFQSEIQTLGRYLDEISEFHREYRDFTRVLLTNAVREVIACFPVYRTYAVPDQPLSETDERVILRATSQARRRNPTIEKAVFDFLRNLLLMRFSKELTKEQYEVQVRFVMKFQQCTSPVMAKGVEDTAFYIFSRLIALNEVGGNPGDFGISSDDFHRLNGERNAAIPHTLLATSTHDTKRSEDVRLRIAALSELPRKWRSAVQKWRRINRKHRVAVDDELAPSRNEEYFLYQTLIGAWPLNLTTDNPEEFTVRIQEYLKKALKEGKINSSWTEPNEEWEKAVALFIARILDPDSGKAFLSEFLPLAEEVALLGAWNSLSAIVLKCTVPGVPDFYQGTELWDLSLVDPDNRRPVDFEVRQQLLKSVPDATPENLISDWKSGRIKLMLIHRLLRFRRTHADFFRNADYTPCAIIGSYSNQAVAFQRRLGNEAMLVVVPRCTSIIGTVPVDDLWRDTRLDSASLTGAWENILTGEKYQFEMGNIPLKDVLKHFPFAVLFQG